MSEIIEYLDKNGDGKEVGEIIKQNEIERLNKIILLCKESLRDKWYEGSTKKIFSPCPFCVDVVDCDGESDCKTCLCPPSICNDYGWEGFVHELHYEGKYINDLSKEDLDKIRSLFHEEIERCKQELKELEVII